MEDIKNFTISVFGENKNLTIPQIRTIYKADKMHDLYTDEQIDDIIREQLLTQNHPTLSFWDSLKAIDTLNHTLQTFDENNWQELDVLGEGTYGKVCKIKNKETTKALKIFKGQPNVDFVREIGTYALLTVANTKYSPKTYGMKLKSSNSKIILDLANGSLWNYTDKLKKSADKIRVFDTIYSLATKALSEFHSCGLIHGDIKGGNILVWWNDNMQICKLVLSDFGMSSSKPSLGYKSGTPGYQAPEFSNHTIRSTQKSDIYALGQTFLAFLFNKIYPNNQFSDNELKI